MKEEVHERGLSEDKRYTLNMLTRLGVGAIIILWGTLLGLKESGILPRDMSTWPFAFVAFGALVVAGGVYRLVQKEK